MCGRDFTCNTQGLFTCNEKDQFFLAGNINFCMFTKVSISNVKRLIFLRAAYFLPLKFENEFLLTKQVVFFSCNGDV